MKNISPKEARDMLRNTQNTIIVDVRTDAEVAEVAIPKSLHIPIDELYLRLHEIPVDANVIFHCQSGGRSSQASIFADEAGYTNVYNLKGGIMEWIASGLPVVRGATTQ